MKSGPGPEPPFAGKMASQIERNSRFKQSDGGIDSPGSRNEVSSGRHRRADSIASCWRDQSRSRAICCEGVCALLQNLSDEIRLCYERAAEAKERADQVLDPEAKADFLNMERRWLLLARSHEFGERLDDFTRENSRRGKLAPVSHR
jgi:hypothetical protein